MSSSLITPLLLLSSSTTYTANAVEVSVYRPNGLRRQLQLQTNNIDTEDNEFYLPDIDTTKNWLFGAGDSSEWGATANVDKTSNSTTVEANHHRPTLINITALDSGEYVTDTSAGTLHSVVVTNQGRILTASSVAIQTSGIGRDTFDGEQLDFQPIAEVYYLDEVKEDSIIHDTNPSTPPAFVKVVASQYYTVALDTAGNAWSTGVNNYGNLCLGDTVARERFFQVPITTEEESTKVVDIALGERHTLFLMDNGKVFGCGWNVWGQLGIGLKGQNMLAPVEILIDEPDFNSTTNVPIVSNVTQIAAGRGSSYFLTSSDHVYASGTNYAGELCLGDRVDRPLPTMLSQVEEMQNLGDDFSLNDEGVVVSLIAAGKSSFYMLFSNGQVLACGKNTHSQLGSESINNTAITSASDVASDVPAAVASLANVTNIFASAISFTAFFLQNDGIHGAGQDSSNQIGNGDMLWNQLSEVSCPNKTRAAFGRENIIISTGNDHTLFLVNSHGIFDCEGNNNKNNTNSSLVPTTTSVPSISPTFYPTTASPQFETSVPTVVPTQIPTGSPVESDRNEPNQPNESNGGARVSSMEVLCLGAAFAAWLLI